MDASTKDKSSKSNKKGNTSKKDNNASLIDLNYSVGNLGFDPSENGSEAQSTKSKTKKGSKSIKTDATATTTIAASPLVIKGRKEESYDAIVQILKGAAIFGDDANEVAKAFKSLLDIFKKEDTVTRNVTIRLGGPFLVIRRMADHPKHQAVQLFGCLTLRALIEAPMEEGSGGVAFEMIKMGALERAIWAFENFESSGPASTPDIALGLMGDMVKDAHVTDLFIKDGGLKTMLKALEEHKKSPSRKLKNILLVLQNLASTGGSNAAKAVVNKNATIETVVEIMYEHWKYSDIIKRCCGLLNVLADEHKQGIIDKGGHKAVSRIFTNQHGEKDVLKVAHTVMAKLA